MRKFKAIAVSAALLLSLSACASQNSVDAFNASFESQPQVCKPLSGNETAKKVQVTGEFGKEPKVSVPAGIESKKFESVEVIKGTGPVIHGNEEVVVDFTLYNVTTGKKIQGTKYDGASPAVLHLLPSAAAGPDYCAALADAHQGSRVVYYMPALRTHAGKGIPSLGVGAKDSIIFVFDIRAVALPRATGAGQPAQNGFPAVVTDKDGVPGIVLPHTPAPALKTTKVATLIKGTGPVVHAGDKVIVHYSGMVWADGSNQLFDSSWQKEGREPFSSPLTDTALIKGWVKALDGQTVGSQVVAVIPPSEGYKDQANNPAIPPNSTLVFVIDLLGKA